MARKLVIAVLASLLAVSLLPGSAGARSGPQEEAGSVILPMPHPQDPNVCFQGTVRRMSMVTQGLYNGPFFGSIFDIDETTWNGKFKLTMTSAAQGSEDIDLFFYKDFGPSIVDDPTMNSPTILAEYNERNDKGEAGKVPAESTKAAVCLWSGVAADWEYKATPPKAKKKKKK